MAHDDLAFSKTDQPGPRRRGAVGLTLAGWRALSALACRLAAHPDPLAEASNWMALTIGTHLPLWPLYVWWSAGRQAFPSSLLTMAMTPLFLAIPWLSRGSGLAGRIAMPVVGTVNTAWTVWVLGAASGSELFLMPCAMVAAVLFRRGERRLMLALTLLPLGLWYWLTNHPLAPLHRYDAEATERLFVLNVFSVGLLIGVFGWFQLEIYRRMEADRSA